MTTRATIELEKGEFVSLLKRLKFFQAITSHISKRNSLQELPDEKFLVSEKLLEVEAASLLLYNKDKNDFYFHTISGGTRTSLNSKPLNIAGEISGNYFSVMKVDEDTTLFFAGDVSGKSISAAFIIPLLFSFLKIYLLLVGAILTLWNLYSLSIN